MKLLARPAPALGATLCAEGVHFALAAPHAQSVELCLFEGDGGGDSLQQTACLDMPLQQDGIWQGFLPEARAGLVYGYRVHGPWAPRQGHRFNPAKLLLDPCAREVLGSYQGQDIHLGHDPAHPESPDTRDNAAQALKARVVAPLPPPGAGVQVAASQRVIYELHIKGFTALHPDIPLPLRGTYAGLAHPAAIAHLKALGITTVCLMPVAFRADEVRLLRLGLSNYWGYSPIAWSAPENRYWSGSTDSPRTELRQLVDALHGAGLEVLLDVVYNHTAETDELGPTLSLRGIDNASYYHLDPQNPAQYLNWTGCGNCVNLNHPLVLRTVMDSLRMWVQEYGVDGFRFDLAPVLARGDQSSDYRFSAQAPFLMAVAQDPVLCHKLMVAEPWDIGPGGYQLGRFPAGWLEWNDRFRDTQRAFWLCGQEHLGALAQRQAGSSGAFDPFARGAHSSVNFVTAHDGFTLTDLVSYQQRHNLANGEDNRDGHGHNLSNNHGTEGKSDDPAVQSRRLQHKRALLAATVLALGTPMLLAGDEIGHSQQGNNNAYCQDNATTWLNWLDADQALCQFVGRLLHLRRSRHALQAHSWWQAADSAQPGAVVARWFGCKGEPMSAQSWNDSSERTLALHLHVSSLVSDTAPDPQHRLADCLLLINAAAQEQLFVLPPGRWLRLLDSHCGDCTASPLGSTVSLPAGSLWLASSHGLFSDTLQP